MTGCQRPCCAIILLAFVCWMNGQTHLATAVGTFKVGIVTSATGPLADIWDESVQGLQLWLRQFSDRYGSSGMPIQGQDTSFPFKFSITVVDDQSSPDLHYQSVQGLINNGSDFIFCAQPAFATNESLQVSSAGRLSLHGTTFNTKVFQRNLPSVFGVTQPNTRYTQELFKQYKSNKISRVAVICRSDVEELASACDAVKDVIQAELLQLVLDVKYNSSSSSAVQSVAQQINASNAEALVACSLQSDGTQLLTMVDQMRKPLKNIFLTNGPAKASFLASVGNISQFVTGPAAWHPDLSGVSDDFYGTAKDYTNKFAGMFANDPTYVAAGTSAMGMVLLRALQAAFLKCNISATGGDPQQLLYSTNTLVCSDNQNNGRKRLIDTMQALILSPTFYGDITFNQFRQNYGSKMLVLQAFQVVKDLKPVLAPEIVLPLSDATMAVQIPQRNRYAPLCGPGTHTPTDDFLPCVPCDPGYFQEFSGKTTCDLCAKDYYANSTGNADCSYCPANSETYQRGSTSQDACFCRVGYYSPTGASGVACQPCPAHAVCTGGTAPPSPLPGWYTERDKPFEMFNCNPDMVCPGGFDCKEGYTGRLCQYCAPGYYMAFNRCLPCPPGGTSMVQMLLMYTLFIFLNLSVSRQLELFHVATGFCQFLSVINLFNVNWPPMYNSIMNVANILSFETDIMQPQCYDPSWRFEQNLYIQLAMPVFVLALVLMWSAFTYICFRIKLRIQGKTMSDFSSVHFSSSWESGGGSSLAGANSNSRPASNSGSFVGAETSAWWLVLQGMVHIPNDPQEMAELVLERLSIPLMTINILYLVILKYCLSAFYCYDFIGTKALYFSASDLCGTPAHYRMMMAATAGLVVYIGGMWAMFYHAQTLLARTRSFGEKRPLLLFGWMYERYSAKYHWYEATQLLQKTGYVLIAVFLVNDPTLQTILSLGLTIFLTLVDIRTNALADSNMHILQGACDAGLVVTLMLGLVFYNDQVTPQTYNLCEVLGLVVLLLVLALLGAALLAEVTFNALLLVLKSRHSKVAKKWGHGIKGHTHMYHVFKPWFMVKWLFHANEPDWAAWHKLCMHLQEYVHPTSETSYLSVKKVGFFWRYLLDNFPETLDYLISIEAEDQEHFAQFIEVMYQHFFDSSDEHKYQLNMVVTDRYRASVAHWLSSADPKDIAFVQRLVASAFGKVHGQDAEEHASRALSRVSKNNLAIPGFNPDLEPGSGLEEGVGGYSIKSKAVVGEGGREGEGDDEFEAIAVSPDPLADTQMTGVGSFALDKTSSTGLPDDLGVGIGSLTSSSTRTKGGKNFAEQFRARGRTLSDIIPGPGMETVHVLDLGRSRLSQPGTAPGFSPRSTSLAISGSGTQQPGDSFGTEGLHQSAVIGGHGGMMHAASAALPPVSDGAPIPTNTTTRNGLQTGTNHPTRTPTRAASVPLGLGSVSALHTPSLTGSKGNRSSRLVHVSPAAPAQLWPQLGQELTKEIEQIDAAASSSQGQDDGMLQLNDRSSQHARSPRPPSSPAADKAGASGRTRSGQLQRRNSGQQQRDTSGQLQRGNSGQLQRVGSGQLQMAGSGRIHRRNFEQEPSLDGPLHIRAPLSRVSETHEVVELEGSSTAAIQGSTASQGSTNQQQYDSTSMRHGSGPAEFGQQLQIGTEQQQGNTEQGGMEPHDIAVQRDGTKEKGSTVEEGSAVQQDRPSQTERAATAVLEEVTHQQEQAVAQQSALEQSILEDVQKLAQALPLD